MKHRMEISGVRLLFGERLILSAVYLQIETGDVVGLLGRNGCGKSSLMRGVYGTLPCDKSVSIDDKYFNEVYKHSRLALPPQRGFIPKWLTLNRVFKDYEMDLAHLCCFLNFMEGKDQLSGSWGNVPAGGIICDLEIRCTVCFS